MDFVRKILRLLMNRQERDGIISFEHQMTDDNTERVITVHTSEDGMIVLTVFTVAEWEMLMNVVELTGDSVEDVVRSVANDEYVATIIFDPKDF